MARYSYIPNRVIDSDGISDGATIYFYETGTTTPVTIYSDAGLTTPVSNPYTVAAGAAVPELFYAESEIRVRVLDDAGAVVSDDDPWGLDADAIALAGGGSAQDKLTATGEVTFAGIDTSTFGDGVTRIITKDRGGAWLLDATGESLVAAQEGETWANSNSDAKQWKLGAPSIMRRLPTYQLAALGTATQNRQRLNRAIDYLIAEGGVELHLIDDEINLDGPLQVKGNVSVIGPGSRACLLKNSETYAFRSSAIIQPGNFHPDSTEEIFGHANTHTLDAVTAGDMAVTLSTASDADNYEAGELVLVFNNTNYLASGLYNLSEYLAIARVLRKSGATLYLDRPIRDSISAARIHNLTDTVINGFDPQTNLQTQQLFACRDNYIGGFSVDTLGYWIADSATLRTTFDDINLLQSRSAIYGNAFQFSNFRNIRGKFGISACEMSHNSEFSTAEDFDLTYDPAMSLTALYAVSLQENGADCTLRNGRIDMGSYTGSIPILRTINHSGTRFENIEVKAEGALTGAALTIGDSSAASGRRVCSGTVARGIKWDNSCGYYVRILGSDTTRTVVEDCEFYGTPATFAVSIEDTTNRNTVRRNHFDSGRLDFGSGVTGQEVTDNYIGGGFQANATTTYTELRDNYCRGNRSSKTEARNQANTMIAGTVSLAATETDIISADIGTGGLQRQDVIEVMVRCSVTGTAGAKTVYLKLVDLAGPTEYTILTWTIASGTTGVVVLTGKVLVTSQAFMVATGTQAIGTTSETPVNGAVTTDFTSLNTRIRLSGILADAGDGVAVGAAEMRLTNQVQA